MFWRFIAEGVELHDPEIHVQVAKRSLNPSRSFHEYLLIPSEGIIALKPRAAKGVSFRESLTLGETSVTREEFDRLIHELKQRYTASTYDVIKRNSNHFSAELVRALTGKLLPPWVNRMARACRFLGFFVPTVGDLTRSKTDDPDQQSVSEWRQVTSILYRCTY